MLQQTPVGYSKNGNIGAMILCTGSAVSGTGGTVSITVGSGNTDTGGSVSVTAGHTSTGNGGDGVAVTITAGCYDIRLIIKR